MFYRYRIIFIADKIYLFQIIKDKMKSDNSFES